jgi:hypothetical protein
VKRLLIFVFLSFFYFSVPKNVYSAGCKCDGDLNVTINNCEAKTPVCGGHGVNATCTCLDNFPTTVPVAGGNNNYLCADKESVDTAIGCIPVKMDKFIAWLLPILFSISGGIAFLLMVYGFILMTTSNGDPKAIAGARETITSAVTGLLISIFAIFIFRLIAVDILKIPGISFNLLVWPIC